ncbi:hypothetical protein MON38_04250 [Hymenobacter sp. DH14]|uniref:Outer membrane protein beta-barrel domain-containing protein n=1 Tax=Hymenobacter cyanobacteriorum TaxID=2926463 RepID=A0A9X1VEI1_9BACT|nr:hypothetical protein [Hymenobacter cyanobacteriorum]MCI1186618.1 hypothetical protein [Hymenobacter cyanobacteriorum]
MKKHFLLLPLLALAVPAAAQRTEIIGRVGLGLFKFSGTGTEHTSFINYSNDFGEPNGYTNNPYSNRFGTGVSFGARAQHVGQKNGLLAFDLGYEWLRNRSTITQLYYSPALTSSFRGAYSADGNTNLATRNVTAFLGLGHRFQVGTIEIDALAGPEAAYVFGFSEKGSGTYNGNLNWAIEQRDRAFNRFDARLRADATAWYHRVGVNASYSYGFINYRGNQLGGNSDASARILRLGLAYRLR